ncbi:hypothetical protein BC834DRAFT_98765 [Gloeopeniophorella convolvens]|nr:hypothetical protein BC834DRAFT_98765 [Gloeopeniophorella convolvens]
MDMASTAITMDADMVESLRRAVRDCATRGLQHASKWAAELLAAVPPAKRRARQDALFVLSTPARSGPSAGASQPPPSLPLSHPNAPLASAVDSTMSQEELALELDEEDILAAGMANFSTREFARAAHTLSACASARGKFLWLYSQYLASEKTALRDWNKLDSKWSIQ